MDVVGRLLGWVSGMGILQANPTQDFHQNESPASPPQEGGISVGVWVFVAVADLGKVRQGALYSSQFVGWVRPKAVTQQTMSDCWVTRCALTQPTRLFFLPAAAALVPPAALCLANPAFGKGFLDLSCPARLVVGVRDGLVERFAVFVFGADQLVHARAVGKAGGVGVMYGNEAVGSQADGAAIEEGAQFAKAARHACLDLFDLRG